MEDVNDNGVVDAGIDQLHNIQRTNKKGKYFFKQVPFGDYLVTILDDEAVLSGLVKTSGTPGLNDHSQADPFDVKLDNTRAPSQLNADFGYVTNPPDYDISGTTWFDVDGDGVREAGESGIGSVQVFLYRDQDNDQVIDPTDPLVDQKPTDSNGFYQFINLPDSSRWLITVDTTGTFLERRDPDDPDGKLWHRTGPDFRRQFARPRLRLHQASNRSLDLELRDLSQRCGRTGGMARSL